MSLEREPLSDKELWRRLAAGDVASASASEPVSDLDFAAWLEGRLSEAQSARVEAAVAADPDMRRAALELAELLGKPLPPAPERLLTRARALVGFEAEHTFARAGLLGWLFAKDRRFAVQRAMALTAALVLAVSGFMLGGGLSESLAQQRYAASSTQTSYSSVSGANELTEFLLSDAI